MKWLSHFHRLVIASGAFILPCVGNQIEHQSRRTLVFCGFMLFLLVFVAYWPSLNGGFVWDDLLLVKKNPQLTGEHTLRSIWFSEDFPLSTLTFWLQWQLWGDTAPGYRVVNVLLHALNGVLLWRVLGRLGTGGAWLAGAMFTVHPVCVASVAWISELKNTLSFVFMLSSVWCFLRGQTNLTELSPGLSREETGKGAYRVMPPTCWFKSPHFYYLSSVFLFLLSLLSKTSTVALPVMLLACVWWQRGSVPKRDWLRVIPFFGLSLCFGLMTIWFQSNQVIKGEVVIQEDLEGRIAAAGMVLWFYLGKALLPVKLCMVYPRWEIDPSSVLEYGPAALWMILLAVCWRFRCRWGRHGMLALGCFTAALFPVLGFLDAYFFRMSRVSDHFQYVALACVVALVSAGIDSFIPKKLLRFVAVLLISVFTLITMQRARVFVSDERLWLDTAARNPGSWNAHNNLGCIRAEQNNMIEAIQYFQRSLELNPRNVKAHVNLGRAAMMQRDLALAESHFQSALRIKNDDPDANSFHGALLAEQGKWDDAIERLRVSLRARFDTQVQSQLVEMLRAAGRIREAVETSREILKATPDSVDVLSNLAWLLATCPDPKVRNGAEAVQLAERACRLTEHKEARPLGILAAAYAEAGRYGEAVSLAQRAVSAAQTAGDFQFASVNQQLLQLYAAGRPYHEPNRRK